MPWKEIFCRYSPSNRRAFLFLYMPAPKFQLLPINDSSSSKKLRYIHHPQSGLKIIVYPLMLNPEFKASAGELCFYGQLFQWWHAFETWEIQESQMDLISDALSWYADRMFYPQMLPQAIDPRDVNKPVVN
jgi:hypothetical protein